MVGEKEKEGLESAIALSCNCFGDGAGNGPSALTTRTKFRQPTNTPWQLPAGVWECCLLPAHRLPAAALWVSISVWSMHASERYSVPKKLP